MGEDFSISGQRTFCHGNGTYWGTDTRTFVKSQSVRRSTCTHYGRNAKEYIIIYSLFHRACSLFCFPFLSHCAVFFPFSPHLYPLRNRHVATTLDLRASVWNFTQPKGSHPNAAVRTLVIINSLTLYACIICWPRILLKYIQYNLKISAPH